jgi:hypothetical protein
MSVAIPAILAALELAGPNHWSGGVQGSIVLVILAITATVGSLLAP